VSKANGEAKGKSNLSPVAEIARSIDSEMTYWPPIPQRAPARAAPMNRMTFDHYRSGPRVEVSDDERKDRTIRGADFHAINMSPLGKPRRGKNNGEEHTD
jgi:hypothetical protein